MHSGPRTCLAAAMLFSLPLAAQWKNLPSKGVPQTADGKVNLSAAAPRSADGHPDLSGIWEPSANRYLRDIAVDLKPGDVPFQPWAKALYDQRTDGSHSKEDPDANCLPQGVPKIDAAPAPWKIVQTPGTIVIVYEAFNLWRQVFLDGRELDRDVEPHLDGLLHRQMGWRHAGGGFARVQRQSVAGSARQALHRSLACYRTVPSQGLRPHESRNHHRRSESVHETLDRQSRKCIF